MLIRVSCLSPHLLWKSAVTSPAGKAEQRRWVFDSENSSVQQLHKQKQNPKKREDWLKSFGTAAYR